MLSWNALLRRHMWQTHGVRQGGEGINAVWMKPAVLHKGLSEKRLKIGLHTGMVEAGLAEGAAAAKRRSMDTRELGPYDFGAAAYAYEGHTADP
jgi:hypothetical protein